MTEAQDDCDLELSSSFEGKKGTSIGDSAGLRADAANYHRCILTDPPLISTQIVAMIYGSENDRSK
eukprot:1048338-Pleurochrysis_carterae.AAC.1